MKVSFTTLGCKVNQYESNGLLSLLVGCGYTLAAPGEEADVYIVNSCTVTAESSRKSRQALRQLRRNHPNAVTVLTGCYSQAFPDEASALEEADIILGNKTNARLPDLLRQFFSAREREFCVSAHAPGDPFTGGAVSEYEGHTRAFVKIQDGCNRRCSYCIIPTARGFSRSKSPQEIRQELSSAAANGYKEIVFVGINLSAYGLDSDSGLDKAVRLAEETPGVERIRLGSLEPDHLTDDVIAGLAACTKFCPQFHLSLQSGSDRILRRMNRHYTKAEYRRVCEKLAAAFPAVSFTTDVIAGFPGETQADLSETAAFIREIGFMKTHVFPFSARAGTPAAAMPEALTAAVKSERAALLQRQADEVRRVRLTQLIGSEASVLFETPKNGLQRGYTELYVPVSLKTEEPLTGSIRRVKLTGLTPDGCEADLLPQ